jgi:rubrerythrin
MSLSIIFPAGEVLNFALTLEHLENDFYRKALAKYSQDDFAKAGYAPWVRGRFLQIAQHEEAHVEFLTTALKAAGIKATQACQYQLSALLSSVALCY